ncbi:MAG: TIM barrel protein [Saprospiraceae bacterium]|nr:TIM barrel protein [Saprospiraceae bacterium]
MYRRDFIKNTTLAGMALSVPIPLAEMGNQKMGIVVHSYALRWNSKIQSAKYPGLKSALDLLDHATLVNAGGIQTMVNDWSTDFARQVRDKREKLGLYLEGSIGLPKTIDDVPKFEAQILNAKEAGAHILRSVTLGPRRYETFKTMKAFMEYKKQALFSLQLAEPILKKHKIKLGVENHKDLRSDEMVTILKTIDSEWIGVTLDFGNNIAILEDPLAVAENLAPYVFSTHIKDMAVDEYAHGFLLSEVPMGTGICDLRRMVEVCKKHNPNVSFNLEMITRDPLEIPVYSKDYWITFGDIPATDLSNMMMLVKQKKSAGLPIISTLPDEQKLAREDENIIECIRHSREKLSMI